MRRVYRFLSNWLVPSVHEVSFPISDKDTVKIRLQSSALFSGVESSLILLGYPHERFESRLFCEFIRPAMVTVDIGANIGYYTLLAAQLVGENGRVFAFEPEPENYDVLLRNIELNGYGNVTPVRRAVTDSTGRIRLFLDKYKAGTHSIGALTESKGVVTVDSVSLDDFFQGRELPISVIKMDIEGAEPLALRGMSRILETNNNLKIFTEFLPKGLEACGSSAQAYFNLLKKHGFQIQVINERTQSLVPVENVAEVIEQMRCDKKTNLLCQR